MALVNGMFKGEIDGKSINDYANQLDYSIENLDKRLDMVNDVLNVDEIGSKDLFWQEVWNMANCKVDISKKDTLWSDTNVAQLLESMGTYLLSKDESDVRKENKRFSRPKKEVAISGEYSSEDYDVVKNDKNYRLAPPDEIGNSDFYLRKVFSKDYSYYKDVIYNDYMNGLKKKIVADSINRYGYHDGIFEEFACSKLIEEDNWNNLKRLELEKIEFLKDAKHNLDILKQQNRKIQEGTLYFRPFKSEIKEETVDIYKYDFMNRIVPCHKQLEKSGYNNENIKEIEEKCLYKMRTRSYGVGLRHIGNNISDVKDYMLSCKLAYTNRVCIDPGKNSVNMDILEHVDYSNPKHIEAILYMQGSEISYENDMSIISYDITKAIKDLRRMNKLDDKDLHIIEGIRHKVTQENIAEELGISQPAIYKRILKISEKIIDIL